MLTPPESYMMPLPTRPRCEPLPPPAGRYPRRIMRGSSALPAFTPRSPPQPSAPSAARSKTSMDRPVAAATSTAMSAIRGAVRYTAGAPARSRDRDWASANTLPRAAPARVVSSMSGATTTLNDSSGVPLSARSGSKRYRASDHTLHGDLARHVRAEAGDGRQPKRQPGVTADRPGERGRRVPQLTRAQLGRVTRTHQHAHRARIGRQADRLAHLAREAQGGKGRAVHTDGAGRVAVRAHEDTDRGHIRRHVRCGHDGHRGRASDGWRDVDGVGHGPGTPIRR